MKLRTTGSIIATLVLLPSLAIADGDLKELADLKIPPAAGYTDTVKPVAPPWCKAGVKAREGAGNSPASMRRTIESAAKDWQYYTTAAQQACLFANTNEGVHATAVLLQDWMNLTGAKQNEAIESLSLRVNTEKFEADKKALCNALVVSSEIEGEDKEFMAARRTLFGCPNSNAQWMEAGRVRDELFPFLDASMTPPDELVLTAQVLTNAHFVVNERNEYFDKWLVHYALDQIDFHAISDAGMQKVLTQAPYANNTYARAVGIESHAVARALVWQVEQEVNKKTAADAEWKTLIVTAPQKALKDWTAQAVTYKDQLARSMEFEKKFWGASTKAAKGCWPTLRKDFLSVVKDMKHANENELVDSLNNPIVAVLFNRLTACAALDQDAVYTASLEKVGSKVRWARGARVAAYYGAVEALGPILEDRKKFSVKTEDLRLFKNDPLGSAASRVASSTKSQIDTMGWVGDAGEGTVKAVKKHAKGTEISFVTTKAQVMSQSCTETNRIVMFALDGHPIYYRSCKDTGLVTINTTPGPIVLPVAEWAEGIKPGMIVKFEATPNYQNPYRYGLPVTVYADKSKKKLVNWMGFAL